MAGAHCLDWRENGSFGSRSCCSPDFKAGHVCTRSKLTCLCLAIAGCFLLFWVKLVVALGAFDQLASDLKAAQATDRFGSLVQTLS